MAPSSPVDLETDPGECPDGIAARNEGELGHSRSPRSPP
jgi:hypothetical protein